MKLKIGNKSFFNSEEHPALVRFDTSTHYYLHKCDKGAVNVSKDDVSLYLEGDLFYYLDNSDKAQSINLNDKDTISRLYLSYGLDGFLNRIEGCFVGIAIDNKNNSITLFCDNLGRADLFYFSFKDNHIFSTNINDIISVVENLGYNQFALYSLFSLGYSPAKHTIYEGIYRLSPMQRIEYKKGSLSINSNIITKHIAKYGDEDIDIYKNIVKESIIYRSSNTENWVQLTGGLDTSIILDFLLQEYDRSKVKPIISSIVNENGICLNSHDVCRAKKLADFYDLKLAVVEVDLFKNNMLDYFERDIETLKESSFVHRGYSFFSLADFLKDEADKNCVVYSGESADSLLNFGFTKTIRYNYRIFNQIEDKIKNYLYSPSFFRQIRNNKLQSHLFQKLLKFTFGIRNFHPRTNDPIMDYFRSFIFSDIRVPFARTKILDDICVEGGLEAFTRWLFEHYLGDVIEEINYNTFYFWLTFIYLNFHLNGRNNNIILSSLRRRNINGRIPYFDMQIVDFLSKMPPNWGRTLSLRETKYPSRIIAKKYSNIPLYIVDDLDYPVFRNCKSIVDDEAITKNKYILDRIKSALSMANIDEKLSSTYFNLDYIENITSRFLADSPDINNINPSLPYNLACLMCCNP